MSRGQFVLHLAKSCRFSCHANQSHSNSVFVIVVVSHFLSGVNCSEIIGRQNCEKVCQNASCVQVSTMSFKCICEADSSGNVPSVVCLSALTILLLSSVSCSAILRPSLPKLQFFSQITLSPMSVMRVGVCSAASLGIGDCLGWAEPALSAVHFNV